MTNVSRKTNLMVKISLLSAIAALFMYFDFPILPAFPWLKIDLSDIPALVGGFTFGPLAGVGIEAFKIALRALLKPSETGGVGELANFIIGGSFVFTAGLIYVRNKTRKNAVIGLIAAVIVMSIVGVLANYFLLIPLYFPGMPKADLLKYLVQGIVPFNLVKGILVSGITIIIYKRVSHILHSEPGNEGKKIKQAS